MIRQLLKLIAGLSLLLCVGIAALWVRSFFVGDVLVLAAASPLHNGAQGRVLFSARGTAAYRFWRVGYAQSSGGSGANSGVSVAMSSGKAQRLLQFADPQTLLSTPTLPGAVRRPTSYDLRSMGFVLRRLDTSLAPSNLPGFTFSSTDVVIGVPHALFVALAATPPLIWLRRARLRAQRAARRCRRCGYDLRASPDRCPECGTPVPKKTEAKT